MKQKSGENNRLPIFTKRFRELQGERTNTEFADFLGISRQTVGFYCNGDRIPDAAVLRQIAEKCEVSADWLLGLSSFKRIENRTESAKELGLSEESINCLRGLKGEEDYNELIFTINVLLSDITNCFDDKQWIDNPVLLSISNYLFSAQDGENDKFYVGRDGKLYKYGDNIPNTILSDIIHVTDLVRSAYLKDIENRLFRVWLENVHEK